MKTQNYVNRHNRFSIFVLFSLQKKQNFTVFLMKTINILSKAIFLMFLVLITLPYEKSFGEHYKSDLELQGNCELFVTSGKILFS